MKTHLKLLLLVLIFSLSVRPAVSQVERLGVGITTGYLNAYNDVRYAYNCYSCNCNIVMDDFTKGNYFAGLTFEYAFKMGVETSLITKLYYNSFSFVNSTVPHSYPSLQRDTNGQGYNKIITSTQWVWTGKYSLLSLDILGKLTLPYVKVGVFGGVSISYVIDTKFKEVYRLLEPRNAEFRPDSAYLANNGIKMADTNRALIFIDGKIPFKNDFRYGLKLGLTYDYDIFGIRISPFVAVDYPLSSVINGINNCPDSDSLYRGDFHWKITYLQAGIDLKYMF